MKTTEISEYEEVKTRFKEAKWYSFGALRFAVYRVVLSEPKLGFAIEKSPQFDQNGLWMLTYLGFSTNLVQANESELTLLRDTITTFLNKPETGKLAQTINTELDENLGLSGEASGKLRKSMQDTISQLEYEMGQYPEKEKIPSFRVS